MTDQTNQLPVILRAIFLPLLLVTAVSACSGGISGTGDGGPIIVVDGDTGANATDANGPDATADTIMANLQIFPASLLSQPLNNVVSTAQNGNSLEAADSENALVTAEFYALLSKYYDAGNRITDDLTLLESYLLNELNSCESQGRCNTLPATASVSSNNTQLMQAQNNYADIQFTQGTAGLSDKDFRYTREDGAQVMIQWSTQEDLLYFFIDTGSSTTYSLTDKLRNVVTLRHVEKLSPALLQATLLTNADSSVTIEADVVDWYIRGSVTPQTTLIYAADQQSSTNRREATLNGETVVTETCARNACVWQPEFGRNDTDFFVNTDTTLGDFSMTINEQPPTTLPSSPARLVISTNDDNGTPASQSIACGSISVLSRPRAFCWQPLPLASESTFIYEEIYNSGISGYRQIVTAP